MQRRALTCAGFSKRKSAIIKVESRQRTATVGGLAFLAPMQTACDHQVEDQPEVVIKTECNAFADAAQGRDFMALNGFNGRISGAEKRRPTNIGLLQHVADD